MADNGVALAQARQQVHTLRAAMRRADRALAVLAQAEQTASITVDADRFDGEVQELVLDAVQAACAGHPGASIEVIVIAHQGTDREEQDESRSS